MEKIKILTDSASDIPQLYLDNYDVNFVPLSIFVPDENKEYTDRIDLSYDEFYEKLENSKQLPSTSQITVYQWEDEFTKCINEGYTHILVITLSSVASGTYQTATLAAKNIKDKGETIHIDIIDSMAYTGAYGVIAGELSKLVKEGISYDELFKNANYMNENKHTFAIINDLKYLKKSGRIKPLSFTLGSLLDIKPIIDVQDGLVAQIDKVRGIKKTVPKIFEYIRKITSDGDGYHISLNYSTDNGTLESVKEILRSEFKKANLVEGRLGCTIGTHAGTGVICIVLIKRC